MRRCVFVEWNFLSDDRAWVYGPPTTPSSGQPSTTGAHSTLTGDGKDKEASDEHSAPFTAHRAAPKPDASFATKCRAVQALNARQCAMLTLVLVR